jgi:peptidoglycan-associated lipoprotein
MKSTNLLKNIAMIVIAGSFLAACAKKAEPEAYTPEPMVEEVAPAPEPVYVEPEMVYESITDLTQMGLANHAGATVHFDYDSSELTVAARSVLEKQAEWMGANRLSISIEGHADERGTREYNLALGERRAVSVKNYLIALGVSGNRLETISYGKERPVSVGNDESAWSQNRRGESVVR